MVGAANPDIPVLVGRDGWLFFTGGSNLESCRSVDPFSEQELHELTQLFGQRRRWLAAQGCEYLLYFAPDKHTIYPEYVPESMKQVGPLTSSDQLTAYMARHSKVRLVDLRPALLKAKKERLLYYKSDTHWNEYGAYVGYRPIIAALQQSFPALASPPRDQFDIQLQSGFSGDTATMLGLQGVITEDAPLLVDQNPVAREAGPVPGWSQYASRCTVVEERRGPRGLVRHG